MTALEEYAAFDRALTAQLMPIAMVNATAV